MPTVNLSCFRARGRFPLHLFPSVPLNHRRTGDAVYSETVSHRPVLTRSSVGWAMSLWVLLAGRRWGRWLCNDKLICCFRGAEPMHERFPLTYSITQQHGLDGNVLTSGVRGGEEDFAECGTSIKQTGKRDFWILWPADKTRCCENWNHRSDFSVHLQVFAFNNTVKTFKSHFGFSLGYNWVLRLAGELIFHESCNSTVCWCMQPLSCSRLFILQNSSVLCKGQPKCSARVLWVLPSERTREGLTPRAGGLKWTAECYNLNFKT